jgi:putative ABC transport system substrate-binding protein
MRSRTIESVILLALSLLCVPLPIAEAQPAQRLCRVGYLATAPPSATQHLLEAFRAGLREHGYVEGQNLVMEFRWVEGTSHRFDELADELVHAKVDLILAWGTPAAKAAKQATSTIPLVMVGIGDPVGAGLVASIARPGGNMTGLTNIDADLAAKRLELLTKVVPQLSQVAVLMNPTNPSCWLQLRETQAAARSLGIELQVVEVREPQEFDSAFAAMPQACAGALTVLADPMFISQRQPLASLALTSRLPSVFARRDNVEAGGLMSYGPTLASMFRQAATYVHKILNGAKPVDLPVEQPKHIEVVLNRTTAQALGLPISPILLFQADEVIR